METRLLNLDKILKEFSSNKIKFVLIGGQAAIIVGSAYSTYVADFCYSRDYENLENLMAVLKPRHLYLRGAEKSLPFIFDALTLQKGLNFTLTTDIGDIDLIGEVTGLGNYDEVLKYSETAEIYGMKCNVLSLEGLIKAKKASGRQKDRILLKELEAIQEIRRRQMK